MAHKCKQLWVGFAFCVCVGPLTQLTDGKQRDFYFLLRFCLFLLSEAALCDLRSCPLFCYSGAFTFSFSVLLPAGLPPALIRDQRASVVRGVPRECLSVGLSLEEDSLTQGMHP